MRGLSVEPKADTLFYRLRRWLQVHAVLSHSAYASWHGPHECPCDQECADWCHDFPVLSAFSPP